MSAVMMPELRRRYIRALVENGICRYCGHDLAGSSSEGCPKCGKPVDRAPFKTS